MFSSFNPHSQVQTVPHRGVTTQQHRIRCNYEEAHFTGNKTAELPNPMTSIKYMAKYFVMEIKAKRKLTWAVQEGWEATVRGWMRRDWRGAETLK